MYTYGVPNLQLDNLIVDFEAIRAELHSNCDLVLLLEFIVHDALHQARFADARVANNDKFEQVILRRQRPVIEHLERYLLDLLDLTLLHYVLILMGGFV